MPKRQLADLDDKDRQAVRRTFRDYTNISVFRDSAAELTAEEHNLHPDTVRLIIREET